MIIFEKKASVVLYNLLLSYPVKGPFLLPANICPIVPMVFYKAQRPFEFIDIALETCCMDYGAIIKRFKSTKPKPAGIVYVRTYGAILDTSNIFSRIKALSPNSLIIDDRCLCPPDFTGSLAPYTDVALYSTGYAKYVDIGLGGFCSTREGIPYDRKEIAFKDSDLAELTKQYQKSLSEKTCFLYKDSDWLDTIPPQESWAAYRKLVEDECIKSEQIKKVLNSIYSSHLPIEIQFPDVYQSWRFNIHVTEKEAVLKAIRMAGLFASGHYDSLAGLFGLGDAPNTNYLHRYVIQLFNDRYFSPAKATKLTEVLSDFTQLRSGPLFL